MVFGSTIKVLRYQFTIIPFSSARARPQKVHSHRDAKDDRRDETVRAILDMHAKHCEITVIGEFDEPQWSVLPEQVDADGS